MTERGSIWMALLVGKIETRMGGSWSAVVKVDRNGAVKGFPTRSTGPAPLRVPEASRR